MSHEYCEKVVPGSTDPKIKQIASEVLQGQAEREMQALQPETVRVFDMHAGLLANMALVIDVNGDPLKKMNRVRELKDINFGPSLVEDAVDAVTNLARRVLRRTR